MVKLLYLDNAATSWPKPEMVYQVHNEVLRRAGNAGRGVNQASLTASRELFQTREVLARLFNIPESERIIFTKNVTEALNVGLQGLLQPGNHVLISAIEHNAVVRPLEHLKTRGVWYSIVPCTKEGFFEVAQLEKYRLPETKMLCCTHASNVLGSIQSLAELGKYCREHNLIFLVDSAQTAGIIPIDAETMNIDFLAFTGHKGLLGPQGTGGYFSRSNLELRPLLYGGTGLHSASLDQPQEWPEGMESGTQNIPGLAALRAGIEYILEQGQESIRTKELHLMEILLTGLRCLPGIEILGPKEPAKRVGLASLHFPHHSADKIASRLDREYGIITRSGLHCSPLAHQAAGTEQCGALRISLGPFNTAEDVQVLLNALSTILGEEPN